MNYNKPLFFLIFFFTSSVNLAQGNMPTGLLCDLLPAPELSVVTNRTPFFGWIVNHGVENDYQTGYQIQLATSPGLLQNGHADLWDPGKLQSSESINIRYSGKALKPGQNYYWRVRTWGKTGKVSLWSQIQQFNTGIFDKSRLWPGESNWVKLTGDNGREFWSFEDREPIDFHDVFPEKIVNLKNGHKLFDFKKDAFAYLTLNISWNPARANATRDSLELSIGEKIIGDSIDQKPGGSIIYESYKIGLKKGTHDYVLKIPRFVPKYPHSQIMPMQMEEVIPFRYCEIKMQPDLKINNIVQKALRVLFDPEASSFTSSDDRLNRIYDMCKYSTIANTFNGDYANSERERMMYEADCYIQQLSHYSIDRKFSTARYSVKNLINHATWPTEWVMHSVFMAWADYLHTGNTDLIEKSYNDLKAKTLMGLATSNGLISTRTGLMTKDFFKSIHFETTNAHDPVLRDIVDWPDGRQGIYPNGETDNYEFKDFNTVVNSFYYRSLVLMGKMASAVKRFEDAEFFEQKAAKVKEVFNSVFYDQKNKIYLDGIGSKHSSLHANMFPVAFDLVPEDYKPSVINFIKSKWMACGVYGVNYLMQALYNAEEGQYALDLMLNDSDRGWINMIRVGATMTTEAWDQKYMPDYYSWNHAWSASPAYIIPRYIMGIQPVEAGFGKIIIKPQPGNLEWAKMKLPSIRGDILATLSQKPGSFLDLNITVPGNTTAKVYLPKIAENFTLTVDGEITEEAAIEGNWVVMDSPSGSHSFRIERKD